jgi:DNA replication protein DnaC
MTTDETLNYLGVTNINNTFDTMKTPRGYAPALDAFKSMAAGTAPYSLLMIYGVTGNGKSRGCEAVVIDMFSRGIRVKRDRWSDIVRTMKSLFNGNNRSEITYDQYFSSLRKRERLILDDVGSGSTLGTWEWGELEDIIDYRYEHQLFTIVTTNLDIKQFPERILSRFRDKSRARLVLNEAADQRPAQPAGGKNE